VSLRSTVSAVTASVDDDHVSIVRKPLLSSIRCIHDSGCVSRNFSIARKRDLFHNLGLSFHDVDLGAPCVLDHERGKTESGRDHLPPPNQGQQTLRQRALPTKKLVAAIELSVMHTVTRGK